MSRAGSPHTWWQKIESALHTLHLFGAAAIASFGWAVCDLLGWRAAPWLPLWTAGALLIYNADRLRRDPADCFNTPHRERASRQLRPVAALLTAVSAALLVLWPAITSDWITLGLVLAGSTVCLAYPMPFFGVRLKTVPVLKSMFAPGIVAAAVFALPGLHEGWRVPPVEALLAAAWAFGFLQWNMLLCDLRDRGGDRQTGIRSVPVLLGETRTRHLLFALAIVTALLAFCLAASTAVPGRRLVWLLIALLGTLGRGALLLATRHVQPERFFERWVEGYLFLPAIAVAAGKL